MATTTTTTSRFYTPFVDTENPYTASYRNPSVSDLYGGEAPDYRAAVSQLAAQQGSLQGQYDQRLQAAMGMLEGMGQQTIADVRRDYCEAAGAAQQQLMTSGLAGSTIAPSMQMGYTREMEDEIARIEEQLRQQRLDTYGQYSGEALQYGERSSLALFDAAQRAAQLGQNDVAMALQAEAMRLGDLEAEANYELQSRNIGLEQNQASADRAMQLHLAMLDYQGVQAQANADRLAAELSVPTLANEWGYRRYGHAPRNTVISWARPEGYFPTGHYSGGGYSLNF